MPSKRAKVVRIPSVTPPKLVKPALLPKHEGREQLRRKYARLSHKHISAVQKLASLSSRRVVAFELGWWALKSTQSALALVRGGKIAICNSRFHDLNRKGGSLRRIDAASSEKALPFSNLRALVAREALDIFEGGHGVETRKYRRVDRDEFLEASFQRMSSGAGGAHVAILISEITDRVRAERELAHVRETLVRQERLRAIGELASGVAHDLNNTLHAMSLRLSLIEQDGVCLAAQGANIGALSRIITDAALVVGRLQDFARQRHDGNIEGIDLGVIIEEATEIVRTGIEGQSSLEGAPVRIQCRLPSLPQVPGVASDLRHVIVNLLLNARDAMPEGGTIRVEGEQVEKRVILKVIDEGRGIPPDDLMRVFDPFFTTKGSRGTGLGLSIAYGVLTRIGGEISATNNPQGGATFTLSFPLATCPTAPPPPHQPASYPPPGRRILVVDDDKDNLEATRMVMELDGQAVDVAHNGPEAIECLRQGRRYDLVLCDLGMPDMNGWRVAREIQTVAPGTTVYMLTGWAQEIAQHDPRRRWVKGVLEKPMNLEHLRELLASELGVNSLNCG